MKKVAIVGCGGSGKSHVARELGRVLDAPVTHLDAVVSRGCRLPWANWRPQPSGRLAGNGSATAVVVPGLR